MLMLMSAVETGQMSAVETRQMYSIKTGQRPVAIVDICLVSAADICPVSAADICPVSTADISISIHHSASAFGVSDHHIMEAATANDFSHQIGPNKTGQRPVAIVDICLVSTADICPVSAENICPLSAADMGISIHHSASAFNVSDHHIMEAATAADFWLRFLAIASLGSDKIASRMRGDIQSTLRRFEAQALRKELARGRSLQSTIAP